MNNHHYNFGARMAAAAMGVSPLGLIASDAAANCAHDRTELDKGLLKLAAAVFEEVEPGSREALLFRRAADRWSPGCALLAEHVSVGISKTATALLPVLAATHDKLGGKLLRTLVAAGVLGGAGAGSLGFLLSRNARQSSAENEELLAKTRTYRQLANDIKEDMSMNAALTSKPKPRRYDV